MLIGLFVIALVVSCAPIVAVVLVSVASRREDADWTLNGAPAPGPLRATARQILDFHSEVIEWPLPKSRAWILARHYAPDWEPASDLAWEPDRADLSRTGPGPERYAAAAR